MGIYSNSAQAARRPGARLRVAFVSFDFGEYCVPIANALAREADVCLLLPHKEVDHLLEALDGAVEVALFGKPRLRQPIRQIRMCLALVRRIRRFGPDVIHLQQGHFWFNLVLPLLRRYPLVLTVHDFTRHPGDRGARNTPFAITSFGFRQAAQLIVHGVRLKQEVVEQLPVPESSVDVVPMVALANGAPLSLADDEEEDDDVVLFFGRIWPYKGLDYLIRAEPLISAQVPGLQIVIAGEGERFDRYRRQMVHPERFVVYNEFVSAEQRARLFARASVVVLPYVEASQSAVVPLAYAFGKPVVATTVGGLPEIVDDGRTGYLVPPGDEEALARAVVTLLKDGELRRQLGENGRRKLMTESSPEAVAGKTLTVYERVVRAES